MTTDQIVDELCKAADNGDAVTARGCATRLKAHLAATGGSLGEGAALRVVEAFEKISRHVTGDDPAALASDIAKLGKGKPVDRAAVTAAWDRLYKLMADQGITVTSGAARQAMAGLRSARMFDLLAKTTDRALLRGYGSGPGDAHFRRLYGQALIDSGNILAGIEILEATVRGGMAGYPLPEEELAQVRGLLGRAHKQIYVNHTASSPSSAVRQFGHALAESAKWYAMGYDSQRAAETSWHGINLVAILKRAQADGIAVDVGHRADDVARALVAGLTPKVEAGTAVAWDVASLAEAHYALGNYAEARKHYAAYAARLGPDSDADAFAIAGSARQLYEVWRAHSSANAEALESLRILNSAVGDFDRSTILVSPEEGKQLQKLFRGDGGKRFEGMVDKGEFARVRHIYRVVEAAAGVASVSVRQAVQPFPAGARVGTAFLFQGERLGGLGSGLFLMTNAHVIADDKEPRDSIAWPLFPDNAKIQVEHGDHNKTVEIKFDPKIVAQFSRDDHDCTILRVVEPPKGVTIFETDDQTVKVKGRPHKNANGTRVCVIGHPEGDELQVSFKELFMQGDQGQVVDYGPREKDGSGPVFIHYDIPTAGGNSGSPVLDRDSFKVVGLHHAGVGYQRLNGGLGSQEANEGICIRSIAKALKAKGKLEGRRMFRMPRGRGSAT